MHFCFRPVLLICLALFPLLCNAAQPVSPANKGKAPAKAADKTTIIEADQVIGKKDAQMEAQGNVEVQQGDQKIFADHVLYQQDSADVTADGNVRIEQPGEKVTGPLLKINMDSGVGSMSQPEFQLTNNYARGSAEEMRKTGPLYYEFDKASYTTCPAGQDDWLLNMSRLNIDRDTQTGTAYNAWVEFQGVPLLYTPWMTFPLDGRRTSGLLGPTFGVTNTGGHEITIPFYWNIAPNYDATIAPRRISKRGILYNNEFRYMGSTYMGEAHYDALPKDKLNGLRRTHTALKHTQNLGGGFGASLNLNHVTDDAYFRDISTTVVGGTQTQLLNEGVLSYGGGWWTAVMRAQTFQTLQDPLAPVAIPYQRLPQITVAGQKFFDDLQVNMVNEYVDFRHPTTVNGQRVVLYPSITYGLLSNPGYFLRPKVGIHSTHFAMGDNNFNSTPDTTRTLPIFSVDSGMFFERDMKMGDGSYIQTLEPRAYYVKIPYQNQDFLPVYDSAQAAFSFAQMFTENRFYGNDRVGDANMITAALTSRIIDDVGGIERLRVTVGQRYSMEAPQVNLITPDANSRSDILAAAGGRVTNAVTLDGLIQYNPNSHHTMSYNLMSRYRPEVGKVLNLGYRYTRGDIPENDIRLTDVSAQWPLFWHWYLVSRISYSLNDQRFVEALGGLEYNQSCWMLRLVTQSFTTATKQVNTGIFVQLELNELVSLGSDPLGALKMSIPGYTKLNAPSVIHSAPASR